jgi:hypothetical protein
MHVDVLFYEYNPSVRQQRQVCGLIRSVAGDLTRALSRKLEPNLSAAFRRAPGATVPARVVV